MSNDSYSLLLSASTAEALTTQLDSLCQAQQAGQDFSSWMIPEGQSLPPEAPRLGIFSSTEALSSTLALAQQYLASRGTAEAWEEASKGLYFRPQGIAHTGKSVGLFAGQGSQYPGMGQELLTLLPPFGEALVQMDQLFAQSGQTPLSQIIFPEPSQDKEQQKAQEERLTLTEHAQPAIGLLSFGLFRAFESLGGRLDATIGHSFGELTALWAAGVFNDADYLFLAKARGQAMAAPIEPGFDAGGMLAVKADVAVVQHELAELPGIRIANLNSREQAVLAGPKALVVEAQAKLKAKKIMGKLLPVSAAFHTPLMGHAYHPFKAALEQVYFQAPKIPIYANSTGGRYPSEPAAIQHLLGEHILNSVLFKTQVEAAYHEGVRVFIEFGPRNILSNLVDNILEGQPYLALSLNPSPKKGAASQLREACLQLRVAGFTLKGI